jgi:hypothetical protein
MEFLSTNMDINSHIQESFDSLPKKVQEKIYLNFYFNTYSFIYNIWNFKIVNIDGHFIEESIHLEDDNLLTIYQKTIEEEISNLSISDTIDKLFVSHEEYEKKLIFYLNYLNIHYQFEDINDDNIETLENDFILLKDFFDKVL